MALIAACCFFFSASVNTLFASAIDGVLELSSVELSGAELVNGAFELGRDAVTVVGRSLLGAELDCLVAGGEEEETFSAAAEVCVVG